MVKGNKENSTKSIGVDLHSLVENINLGVYRTSDSGELLYCNPALARILGYKNIEELKQIPVANHFVNQLDRDSQLQEWKDNKEKISNEVLLKTKSGKQIRIQDTGRIIRGKNREQSYYEGVMEDISKRREIEKELKISEERLKLSLKGSDEKIWDWNAVKGDAYFETLPGYEPGDIEDHYNSWEKLVHPDDLNKVLEILNKHLKGASDFYKAEYRVRNKSGDWIWILGKGKVVERDRNGKALRVVGTHTDITDRVKVRLELERYKDNLEKLVEERTRELLKKNKLLNIEINKRKSVEIALKESENNWRSLSENIPDVITNISKDGTIKFINKTLGKFAISKMEVIGKNIYDFVPEEHRPILTTSIHKVLDTGKHSEYDVEIKDLNGKTSIFRSRIGPIYDNKNITGLSLISTDITERKKQEEALYKSEEMFRMITQASPGAIVISGPDGKVTYASKQTLKVLNYEDVNEIIGKNAIDQFAPESRILALKNWIKIKNNDLLMPIRYSMLKKDGTVFPAELTSVAVRDKDGNAEAFLSVISDITKQLKTEKMLKGIAEDWNKTFDTISDCITLLDNEGLIVRCNKAFAKFMELTFKKVIGKPICELIHKKMPDFDECLFEQIKNSNKRVENNVKLDKLCFRSIMEPIFAETGELTGVVHVLRDITDEKKKELKLREQKEFIQIAIDSLTHPFYIIDINSYKIIMKNKATDIIFPAEETLCYAKTHDLTIRCSEAAHICPISEIKRTGKPIVSEHLHISKDNCTRIFETHSFPIFNKSGNLIQIIQYSIDITERKNAEKESEKQKENLRHADRMISLGILVSGVAHEINNPNNAIILNSSFLKRSYKDIIPILDNYYSKSKLLSIGGLNYNIFKDEINDIFTGITRSSNKIKAIVEELKQYSRKDKLVMRSEVEINLVIKSALNLLHGMIKKSTMDLRVSYKKNLPAIYGNFQNIEQVIINLIQNSCQALTSKDKSVSISTSIDKTEKFIVIEVADEGSGIDEKDLKYIEDPFFTTKRNSGGVGLGLSVSSKIIEEHGGSMSFSSKLNIGTIVRVMLPVLGSKHNGE